jgi:hypothetical protein
VRLGTIAEHIWPGKRPTSYEMVTACCRSHLLRDALDEHDGDTAVDDERA